MAANDSVNPLSAALIGRLADIRGTLARLEASATRHLPALLVAQVLTAVDDLAAALERQAERLDVPWSPLDWQRPGDK